MSDFTSAASANSAGGNPYADPRFVTPPLSLTVGWLELRGHQHAAAILFVANSCFIAAALYIVCRRFDVPRNRYLFITSSAFAFYPVFFLLERGNIDGILLLLFAISIATTNCWVKIVTLSLGNNLKLYTLVPTFNLLWRGSTRYGLILVGCTILISLPFLHLDTSFLHNLAARTQLATGTENLSPALIAGSLLKFRPVKTTYILAWLGSLCLAMYRLRHMEDSHAAAWLSPWMVALPLQVYPYSGILLLFVWIVWSTERSSAPHRARDRLMAIGLCLVGVQQQAMTNIFGQLVHSHRFFPFLNALGVLFLMISAFLRTDAQYELGNVGSME